MSTLNITEEMKTMFIKSGDESLCEQTLLLVEQLCKEEHIAFQEHQWLSLASHISAMVHRSLHHTQLDSIEKEMFNQISDESIDLARKVSSSLPNLQDEEAYLLSIHFETAKQLID